MIGDYPIGYSIATVDEDRPVIVEGTIFDALLEYSTSLPTGTTPGKQWRRRHPAFGPAGDWWIGEYGPAVDGRHAVTWRRLLTRWDADARSLLCHARDAVAALKRGES